MERGVLAIFGGIPADSVEAIKSFVNFHNVPFIAWNSPPYQSNDDMDDIEDDEMDARVFDNDEIELTNKIVKNTITAAPTTPEKITQPSFYLNMYPDITSVLISIIKYDRHKTVYYLYNDISALDRLQSVLDYQVKETDFISDILPRKISKISEAIDLIRTLENEYVEVKGGTSKTHAIKDNEITIMIDFVNPVDGINLLSRVKDLGIKRLLFHYVLVTLVKHLQEKIIVIICQDF